jgi:hypothetical protein
MSCLRVPSLNGFMNYMLYKISFEA